MKKKMLIVLLGVLLISGFSNAQISGEVAATITPVTSMTIVGFPSAIGLAPASITSTTGTTDYLVVDDIVINDNSLNGWTLAIAGTGNLVNGTETVAYTLEMGVPSAGLGTGLGITPAVGTALGFGAGAIETTATATTATVDYTFDLLMNIGAAHGASLAGNYAETITLTLSAK